MSLRALVSSLVSLGALALACALGFACAAPAHAAPPQAGPSLVQRIRALEAEGRGHPQAASRQLEALWPETAAGSAEQLELLTVQGVTLATASLTAESEQVARRLDAWSAGAGHPQARLAAAAAMLVRARARIREGELKPAEALMRSAMAQLPADLDPVDRSRFVVADALVAIQSGRLEDAVRLNQELAALVDRHDAVWRQSDARSALAMSYYRADQYVRAARIAAEAVALAEQAHDWVSLGRARNMEALAADGLNDIAGERRGFEAAIDAARRAGAKNEEVRYLGNLADYFLQTAAYPAALQYSLQALALAGELGDRNTELVAMTNAGLAQISLHQKDVGLANVLAAIEIEQRRGLTFGVADSWRNAGVYLERAGYDKEAVDAFHRHRRVIAEVSRDDQQKAVLALQEQSDAEMRARELKLLAQDRALKAEKLHRRSLRQGVDVLAALVSLLALVAVALLYRRTRETNRRLARRNEMLKSEGERDPLTGLANRRRFHAAMRRRSADGPLRGAIFLIDLDHFKSINDRIGHGAGDAVLVEVARRLREIVRDDDLLVRWGGEEFLLVVRGLVPVQVEALAQRLLAALEDRPIGFEKQTLTVTGSIGFASFPLGADVRSMAVEPAVTLVDAAMYLAKAGGRNRACGVVELAGHADAGDFDAAIADLGAAVRDGRVRLTTVHGRRRVTPVEAPPGFVEGAGVAAA